MKTAAETRAFSEGFNAAAAEQRSCGCTIASNPYLVPGPCQKAWDDGAKEWERWQAPDPEFDDSEDD